MAEQSFFQDDWQDCLRAHYMHVVRMEDWITESTLRGVLVEMQISEDLIDDWFREASNQRMEQAVEPQTLYDIEPAESEMDDLLLPEDEALPPDDEIEIAIEDEDKFFEDEADDEPPPAQLSMF